MAYISETHESREISAGKSPGATLRYIITDTDDEKEALDLLQTTAPDYYQGLVRESRRVSPTGNLYTWLGDVSYAVEDDEKANDVPSTPGGQKSQAGQTNQTATVNESTFSFSVSMETVRITQSRSHIATYPSSAISYNGAIDYDGENVNGCEIIVPKTQFSQTKIWPSTVTFQTLLTQVSTVAAAPVNTDAFYGFEPGEVLFLGASGSRRGVSETSEWEISYEFAVAKNLVNYEVAPGSDPAIIITSAHGWYYVSCEYRDQEYSGRYVKLPYAAHVERVYDESAFSVLGLGGQ
jgi:hypothetical protein